MHFSRGSRIVPGAAVAILLGTGLAAVPTAPAFAATWTVVTTPNASVFANQLTGVDARATTDVWAVGSARHDTHPGVRPLAMRWNGTGWTVVNTPTLFDYGSFSEVDAVAADNAMAVGSQEVFVGPTFTRVALTERWNGSGWSVVTSPLPAGAGSSHLDGVRSFSAADTWAVGHYTTGTAPATRTLIQRFNGSSWSVVAGPNPNASFNQLLAVDGASATDVWAVGTAGIGNASTGLALRWNGSAWSAVTLPAPPAGLTGVRLNDVSAVAANDVWVVGQAFNSALRQTVFYYLRWNGSTWQNGSGPNLGAFTSVAALSATQVYASAGGTMARWTGSGWVAESVPAAGTLEGASAVAPGTIWAVGIRQDPVTSQNRTSAVRTTNG